MVKALQRKFEKTAMIAITVLLAAIVCAISVMNAYSEMSDAGRIARMLADNGGIPEFADGRELKPGESELPWPGTITEDSARSARFFLVAFDEGGTIVKTDTSRISSVSAAQARETAQEIYELVSDKEGEARKQEGLRDGMLYCVSLRMGAGDSQEKRSAADAGAVTVVCVDISDRVSSIISVLIISVVIGIVAWVLMLFLVILLSRRAIAPIAENISRQKQFVTNAGHEIKTPLAIILANTDALELHTGESKWTRNIRSQTKRLSGLMQNLLTLSKMDEAQLQLPMTDFDLGEAAEESLRQFKEPAQARDIALALEIGEAAVHANRDSIMQLICILLDNAVKYTPDGGMISLCVHRNGKFAVLEESNTIDTSAREEDPEKLFDRFYRSDRARTQKSGGYGIGLSAARAIAAANKASVRAAYRGEDTIVFTLRLMI